MQLFVCLLPRLLAAAGLQAKLASASSCSCITCLAHLHVRLLLSLSAVCGAQMFHQTINYDGLWLDMDEVSNYCTGDVCQDPGAQLPFCCFVRVCCAVCNQLRTSQRSACCPACSRCSTRAEPISCHSSLAAHKPLPTAAQAPR